MKFAEIDALMKKPEAERRVLVRNLRDSMLLGTLKEIKFRRARVLLDIHKRARPGEYEHVDSYTFGQVLGEYKGELKEKYDADLAARRADKKREERIAADIAGLTANEGEEGETRRLRNVRGVVRDDVYVDVERDSVSMGVETAERLIARAKLAPPVREDSAVEPQKERESRDRR